MPTEKQNLTLPAEGAQDWHIPLNENFKKLDAASVLQVPSVDELKSNYSPTDETLAFIEGSQEFWSGTGSQWSRIGYAKQTPNDVYVQSTEPSNADDGDIWIVP